ncbi:hypothetical protein [Fictibacillus sp. S7]|uniref:hypothetical protein n=1 Tax=Fictibacillus sp. S7 TaxID=2212476 RepID=UPI00101199A5|nr:hypothetical protein [Fictibacillus sp. S7]
MVLLTYIIFHLFAPFLTPVGSFAHGLGVTGDFFGVDQMALDATQSKLFISLGGILAVLTASGTPLGTIPGVYANEGISTC